MRKIEVYVAADGARFDDPEDCELYENENQRAKLLKKLGINSGDATSDQRTIGWFVYALQKAIEVGALYEDSPTRTAFNHLRKWLDQDQAMLVSAYQDWLAKMGAELGRTPRAVHGRLRIAHQEMEANGERIGY